MKQYFNKSRIRLNELYNDSVDFLSEKFKQTGHLFSITSAYGQILSVVNQLMQFVLFYVEDSITELNINQATRPHNIYGLARLTGHNPTRAISATGQVTVGFNGKNNQIPNGIVIIPNQTRIKCSKNGLEYVLDIAQTELRIPLVKNRSINIPILQGKWEQQLFTGNGQPLQSFMVNMKPNKLIENFNIKVFVNSKEWKKYDSIYDMPFDKEGCLIKTGITSGVDIYFGNGYNGKVPPQGSQITVEYLITDGVKGEVALDKNMKWTWLEGGYDSFGNEVDLNEVLEISLTKPANFAANPENPNLTKLLAPKISKSLILARPENYIYFFEKFNLFSIVDAWTTFNDDNLEDDNVIYLYLIPDIRKRIDSSENYFTTQLTDFKLTDDEKTKLLELLKNSQQTLMSSIATIVEPIIKKYIAHINLITFEGYSDDNIKEEIIDKLSEYLITNRRRDRIPKSDLIRIIENIDGVDTVNIYFLNEENELSKKYDANTPDFGFDDFGDIIMDNEELAVLRGGFSDRNGVWYEDGINFNRPSSVNITIKGKTPLDYNARINIENKNKLTK